MRAAFTRPEVASGLSLPQRWGISLPSLVLELVQELLGVCGACDAGDGVAGDPAMLLGAAAELLAMVRPPPGQVRPVVTRVWVIVGAVAFDGHDRFNSRVWRYEEPGFPSGWSAPVN